MGLRDCYVVLARASSFLYQNAFVRVCVFLCLIQDSSEGGAQHCFVLNSVNDGAFPILVYFVIFRFYFLSGKMEKKFFG